MDTAHFNSSAFEDNKDLIKYLDDKLEVLRGMVCVQAVGITQVLKAFNVTIPSLNELNQKKKEFADKNSQGGSVSFAYAKEALTILDFFEQLKKLDK